MAKGTVTRILQGQQTRSYCYCRGLREDGLGWEYGFCEKKRIDYFTYQYFINGHRVEPDTVGEYTGVSYHGQKLFEDDLVAIPNEDDVFLIYWHAFNPDLMTSIQKYKGDLGEWRLRSLEVRTKAFSYVAVPVGNAWEDKEVSMPDPKEAGFVDEGPLSSRAHHKGQRKAPAAT